MVMSHFSHPQMRGSAAASQLQTAQVNAEFCALQNKPSNENKSFWAAVHFSPEQELSIYTIYNNPRKFPLFKYYYAVSLIIIHCARASAKRAHTYDSVNKLCSLVRAQPIGNLHWKRSKSKSLDIRICARANDNK
jgi:hypothetical protein